MVWPFSHFRKPPAPLRGTIEAIYGMIVAQAREPLFYRDLSVPDTGRRTFRHVAAAPVAGAAPDGSRRSLDAGTFDRFCADMDDNLRELGTSDLKVPKKMQEFGRAFYGRTAAYDAAIDAGREALAASLSKNIYNGKDIAQARRLAVYAEMTNAHLGALAPDTLSHGAWQFPQPATILVTT